jgi:NADH dehydrogenase
VNVKVTGVSDDGVTLSDGVFLRSRMVIWTAGTSANPQLASLPCHLDRGRICVDSTLAVPGWPNVWALGDCALIPDARTGEFFPPTAQHALRQARVVAHNIAATVRGGTMRKFSFATIGQLAAIGRRSGVANILGVNFSGVIAWFLWRSIYLSKLPRMEKKVRVVLDWTLDLVFSKDLVQYLTFRAPSVSEEEMTESYDSRGGKGGFSRS